MSLYKNWEDSIQKAAPAMAQGMLEEYYGKEKDAYAKVQPKHPQRKRIDRAVNVGVGRKVFHINGKETGKE